MKHHIYHHNDMDGHASGAITAFGLESQGIKTEDIFFYRMNYGQPFDDSQVDYEKDTIYVVDFSLQPYDKMSKLIEKANLVWIDHHKTSRDWLLSTQYGLESLKGILDDGPRAACELCWGYFFSTPIPDLVKRISQYDVWNKDYPKYDWEKEQIPLQMYLRNMETRPAENMHWWRQQFKLDKVSNLAMAWIDAMISEGQILQDYQDKQLRRLTLDHGYDAELCGNKVFALNTPQGGSRQFEVAIDMDEYDMVCAFRLYKGQYWVVNLYSTKENINCGELAQKLGAEGPCKSGGGHPGAAGFQTSYDHLMSVLKPLPKEREDND
jgi:oligoribonuclease NrnB/cAMP/cGMP phosphodiesterase (DHH superfamily)